MSTTAGLRRIGARGAGRRTTRRTRTIGVTGGVAITVLGLVVCFAVLAPLLAPHDPNAVDLSGAYQGSSGTHVLGTDASGRDLLSRLIYGSRTALIGPFLVVAISTLLGTVLALAAVWFGGWFDQIVVRVVDAVFAFPGLLLAILATALFGSGLKAATAALSIAYVPYIARIVRSASLRERSLPYIAALRVQGVHGLRIALRHILLNVGGLIVANATLAFGFALMDFAGLSFIGLGVQPPTSDWGAMVGTGMAGVLQQHPQEALFASALIVVTVGAVNMLGDRLTERWEARS
ncbi:ABC transporter permease [Streptomyces nodosus]|uniref:ABC transporter permease n=1 Tax=Streptomyces nodosus TaxID=40318 RepID=A0A0B5DQT1_9ACTN|nr:ABC transporter permease [Streptomyces nodosus]AJE43640.1 ABC transporter permease [Streptomyces nodosus]MBB4795136.1 peptide/nickel transport system permease protein [Streptomyces nodosus]